MASELTVDEMLDSIARAIRRWEHPATARSDLAPTVGVRERTVSASPRHTATPTHPPVAVRPLSQIEIDLNASDADFSDAEARRQQGEADAGKALEEINKLQAEIDAAIDRLRRISPAGSIWSRQAEPSNDVLCPEESDQ